MRFPKNSAGYQRLMFPIGPGRQGVPAALFLVRKIREAPDSDDPEQPRVRDGHGEHDHGQRHRGDRMPIRPAPARAP